MVTGFDTETHLIAPGLLAPPLVCIQYDYGPPAGGPYISHRCEARDPLMAMLMGNDVITGHNVAFDMCVIAAKFPDLLPAIFAKYDRDEVTCSKIREQLIMVARGQFRFYQGDDGELYPVKYTLADCVGRHFSKPLKKEGFRLFYRMFDDHPDVGAWPDVAKRFQDNALVGRWPQWALDIPNDADRMGLLQARPDEAVAYALEDARQARELHASQDRVAASMACTHPGVLDDQYRQARAAFALALSSAWGVHTDPDAVETLAGKLQESFDSIRDDLQAEGVIRGNGTADTAAARAVMVASCAEDNIPVIQTKGGAVSLSSEACGRFDEHSVIGQYSEYLTLRKTLSNDVKMLRSGCDVPIQPRYDLADTGRTRCAKPNIQAINRGEGIRECFRPREGTVFIQGDFEGLELHTLAQWCLTVLGKSELAKLLNDHVDVHTLMAANMIGKTYDEAMAEKEAGSEAIKEYRQRAKAVNFGLPGGLGAKKLARYAKVQYGANMSEGEAVAAKQTWLNLFPEMAHFFASAAMATRDGDADERHVFTGRWRGKQRYSALCNGRFQGLGADAAKEALWRVSRACYVDKNSPLYSCRIVAFIHDEIIAECVDEPVKIDAAARELGRLMCEGANVYLKDVPVRVEPQAMRLWSKKAKPTFDAAGRLVPWAPDTLG